MDEKPKGNPPDPSKLPRPRPEYKPSQVVRIVTDALRHNDPADDRGIAVTFNFASPDNQAMTGPLERFVPMVKNPIYAPLLNCADVELGEEVVAGDQAAQLATVTRTDGEKAYYLFRLSKQSAGEYKDCWMTDAVVRVEPKQKVQPTGGNGNGRYGA